MPTKHKPGFKETNKLMQNVNKQIHYIKFSLDNGSPTRITLPGLGQDKQDRNTNTIRFGNVSWTR